jgi:hypothetical protein
LRAISPSQFENRGDPEDSGKMKLSKVLVKGTLSSILLAAATLAPAAQLSTDARTAIPHEVQQLVVIDYRAMQNSTAAMELRDRVMPAELKQFDEALRKSSLNGSGDFDRLVDQLAFALFRPGSSSKDSNELLTTVGIAQGQFPLQDIQLNLRKQKLKATLVRSNKLYAMGKTGMVACFVDSSTMIFGSTEAVTKALDARDGVAPNMLTNATVMDAMRSVDASSLWSILDQKGTQTMIKQVLGEAGSITDYEAVRKRLLASWYSMDFQHGVKFDLTLSSGDTFTAATLSTLLNAALLVRKMSGTEAEKQALAATSIQSDTGRLSVHFATSNSEFNSLLQSPLFRSMVR